MNEIAELNDRLRRTFTGGKVVMTAAVAALDPAERGAFARRGESPFTHS